jgi:hypothetical protein
MNIWKKGSTINDKAVFNLRGLYFSGIDPGLWRGSFQDLIFCGFFVL